ncbi:MAG: hypothetical protein IJM72_05475 [Deltaproteobacteria bacterium]|nr:hypothetical protein [Deltaproteobacteria bacterium]
MEIANRKMDDLFKFANRKCNQSAEVLKAVWLAHDAETGKVCILHPRKTFHCRRNDHSIGSEMVLYLRASEKGGCHEGKRDPESG